MVVTRQPYTAPDHDQSRKPHCTRKRQHRTSTDDMSQTRKIDIRGSSWRPGPCAGSVPADGAAHGDKRAWVKCSGTNPNMGVARKGHFVHWEDVLACSGGRGGGAAHENRRACAKCSRANGVEWTLVWRANRCGTSAAAVPCTLKPTASALCPTTANKRTYLGSSLPMPLQYGPACSSLRIALPGFSSSSWFSSL